MQRTEQFASSANEAESLKAGQSRAGAGGNALQSLQWRTPPPPQGR